MPDLIPDPDGDFDNWCRGANEFLQSNGPGLGFTTEQLTALAQLMSRWAVVFPAHRTAQTAARAARVAKDEVRNQLDRLLRPHLQRLQFHPDVTDEHRAKLSLTVRKPGRTRAALPTTHPLLHVRLGERFQHVLVWADEAMPSRRARPRGVRGAEVWIFVGAEPPADPAQCRYVGLATRTPLLVEHDGALGGQRAHYFLRWVSTRGEPGPWSPTVSATIPG